MFINGQPSLIKVFFYNIKIQLIFIITLFMVIVVNHVNRKGDVSFSIIWDATLFTLHSRILFLLSFFVILSILGTFLMFGFFKMIVIKPASK